MFYDIIYYDIITWLCYDIICYYVCIYIDNYLRHHWRLRMLWRPSFSVISAAGMAFGRSSTVRAEALWERSAGGSEGHNSSASRRGRDKRGFHRRATNPYILPCFPHVIICYHILPTFSNESWLWGIAALLWWPRLSWPRLEAVKQCLAGGKARGQQGARRRLATKPTEAVRGRLLVREHEEHGVAHLVLVEHLRELLGWSFDFLRRCLSLGWTCLIWLTPMSTSRNGTLHPQRVRDV